MITMLGTPRRCCDGLTRRETLKAGALSLLSGFTLPNLLQAEEARGRDAHPGKAKSVILLYLLGGAATQDMIDLTPSAPAGPRGRPPRPGRPNVVRGTPILPERALATGLTVDRLDHRRTLLQQLDEQMRRAQAQPAVGSFDRVRQRAFDLLTSAKVRSAF